MIVQKKQFAVFSLLASLLAGCVSDGAPGLSSSVVEPGRPSVDAPSNSPERRSAKVHVELGHAYMLSGRNGVALDEARAAIASDAAYAPGHLLLGMVYAAQEQFALAVPGFEEAARLAPGDPEVANAYGWFLCSQGREAEGLPRLEAAARNPYYATPTRAWTNAAVCLLRKKDEVGAEARLLRAVEADAANAQALVRLADLSLRTDRALRAKHWMDQAQKAIRTMAPEVLWLAARIEHRLGNTASVQSLGDRLRQEFPGSNEYQFYRQGKFE